MSLQIRSYYFEVGEDRFQFHTEYLMFKARQDTEYTFFSYAKHAGLPPQELGASMRTAAITDNTANVLKVLSDKAVANHWPVSIREFSGGLLVVSAHIRFGGIVRGHTPIEGDFSQFHLVFGDAHAFQLALELCKQI